jgi:TRAP-type C4-dicarboxylate transport system substrate-binding protein
MNEELLPIADCITLVANDQAGEATGLVHDLLGARVLDALQSHKQEIAKTLFAPSADALTEEVVQEEHESVEDFVKRGGKIKHVPAADAKGAQKPQTIKKAKHYFHSRMNKG